MAFINVPTIYKLQVVQTAVKCSRVEEKELHAFIKYRDYNVTI